MQNKQKQGCWNNRYRYHFDLYRYRLSTISRYRYRFERYHYRLPSASLYRYSSTGTDTPYRFLPRNVRDFAFSLIFLPQLFYNSSHIKKPPWNLPKNNSKCGLDSIKIHFPQVRAFHLKSKSKAEVRVLIYYLEPLQISPSMLLGLLEAKSGKGSHQSLIS